MRARATWLLVSTTSIALIAVGAMLLRTSRAGDEAGLGQAPSAGTGFGRDIPSAANASSSAASRISRAPFTEPVEASAADPVDPGDDDPSVPVPAHLRRVTFTLEFDDETPLAGVRVGAETFEDRPAGVGRGTASTDEGAIVRGTTTASGRVSFLIPREAKVRVFGLGGELFPPFRSEWFGPDVAETRAVFAAVPVRLAIVDDAGWPVPDLKLFANGRSPVGRNGMAKATTDAEGRAILRGFAAGESLLIGLDQAGVYFTRDCDRFAVTAVLGGEPFDPDSPESFSVTPPADLKVTVRRMPIVGVRVVDPTGKPVAGATVGVSFVIAGSATPIEFDPYHTNWDGRYSRPLPLNGKEVGLDAVIAEIRFSVTTRDGRGPYVAVRPGPPPGGVLDAGDIVVPALRLLEFQVVDDSGRPVVGAALLPVGPDGLPDYSRLLAESEVDGRLTYPARPDDVRFLCGGDQMSDAFVDAPLFADAAADAAVRSITLRRAASFFFKTDGDDLSRYQAVSAVVVAPARTFSRLKTRSTSPDSLFERFVDLRARIVQIPRNADRPTIDESLDGIEPGAAVTIEFRDDQGTYATGAAVAPAAGETRTIIAPLPPPETTLIVEVTDTSGRPMNVIEVLVRTIPTVGEPTIVAKDDVVDGRCVVAGLRAGRVQVRVDSDPSTDVEVALAAPETKLVVRLPVQRVVVLALVGPDANEPPDDFSADAFANGRRLNALLDDVPEELPPPPEEKGRFVSARAPADAPVEFRLRWGGTDYAVTAGPGVARIEWTPPVGGRLLVKQLRRAVAAEFELHVVRIHPARGAEAAPPPSVHMCEFGPSEEAWAWEPVLLTPGRYRIELHESVPSPRNPLKKSDKLLTSSEVEIVAGREAMLDFPH